MKVLDKGRLHISAISVGVAERLIEDATKYAIERKQFNQPIAEFQLVQAISCCQTISKKVQALRLG
jgi:acyl-CoA dehydrogenase